MKHNNKKRHEIQKKKKRERRRKEKRNEEIGRETKGKKRKTAGFNSVTVAVYRNRKHKKT